MPENRKKTRPESHGNGRKRENAGKTEERKGTRGLPRTPVPFPGYGAKPRLPFLSFLRFLPFLFFLFSFVLSGIRGRR